MARMFKVEMYVIPLNIMDDETYGNQDLIDIIKCGDLSKDCRVQFGDIDVVDIGSWHDDHKFNYVLTDINEYRLKFREIEENNEGDK